MDADKRIEYNHLIMLALTGAAQIMIDFREALP